MKTLIPLCGLIASTILPAAALAQVSKHEAIEAQLSSALASADYARRRCPNLRIDQAIIDKHLRALGKSEESLRRTESYAEQADVLKSLAGSNGRATICALLPSAHGGYGRGIIRSS